MQTYTQSTEVIKKNTKTSVVGLQAHSYSKLPAQHI